MYRALPLFVVHRMNWDILYPHVDLDEEELLTLSSHGTYIAGFTDSAIEGRTDLYDLFVNGKKLFLQLCLDSCLDGSIRR